GAGNGDRRLRGEAPRKGPPGAHARARGGSLRKRDGARRGTQARGLALRPRVRDRRHARGDPGLRREAEATVLRAVTVQRIRLLRVLLPVFLIAFIIVIGLTLRSRPPRTGLPSDLANE